MDNVGCLWFASYEIYGCLLPTYIRTHTHLCASKTLCDLMMAPFVNIMGLTATTAHYWIPFWHEQPVLCCHLTWKDPGKTVYCNITTDHKTKRGMVEMIKSIIIYYALLQNSTVFIQENAFEGPSLQYDILC